MFPPPFFSAFRVPRSAFSSSFLMKRFSQRGMYNPVADINIVPMMDLVWNLLIVFMLATPLLEQSIDVKLSKQNSTGTPLEAKDVTTVNLDSSGRAFVNGKPTTLAQLEQLAKNEVRKDPQHAVVVRGDEKVPYGKFVEIVDHLKLAGVTKLGIVGLTGKS